MMPADLAAGITRLRALIADTAELADSVDAECDRIAARALHTADTDPRYWAYTGAVRQAYKALYAPHDG